MAPSKRKEKKDAAQAAARASRGPAGLGLWLSVVVAGGLVAALAAWWSGKNAGGQGRRDPASAAKGAPAQGAPAKPGSSKPGAPGNAMAGRIQQIVRAKPRDLSVYQFLGSFVSKGPVIIPSPQPAEGPPKITMKELSELCPQMTIDVKKKGGRGWANLAHVGEMTIPELVKAWESGQKELYGFEGDIACLCPALLERLGVRVPPYFGDDVLWEHSTSRWPSLLMGPTGTTSAMHIDRHGLPFWLHLATGQKRVRVIVWEQVSSYLNDLWNKQGVTRDHEEMAKMDFFDPKLEKLILQRGVTILEGVMQPGDLLYIPPLAAHAVQNIGGEVAIAVSGNFVDFAHSLQLHRHQASIGCVLQVNQAPQGCEESMMNIFALAYREGEAGDEAKVGGRMGDSWQKFTDWTAAYTGVPWCYAKAVNCKIMGHPLKPLIEACNSSEAEESLTTLALAASPHMRSAGLSNFMGNQILREFGKDKMREAEKVLEIGAAYGHTMALRNMANVRKALDIQAREPNANIKWNIPDPRGERDKAQ